MSVTDLLTYANSADCCHVVNVAINDATLGKFYAENGFIPELEDIPDSVFDKLDFAKIGREARESEKGVFTKYGYVVQNEKLRPIAEPVYTLPQIPGYAFRLRIGRYPFDTDEQPEKEVHLELPTTEDRIARALEECGAANWAEVIYEVEDSAIPGQEEYTEYEDIVELNEFAGIIKRLEAEGQLTKLKAVLHATNCADVTSAISIAEALDLYDYDPDKRTAKEVALADLRRKIAEPTLTQLLSYVFLEEYGLDLMVSENAMVTPYGLVEFGDEEMILGSEESHKQDGMVMQ